MKAAYLELLKASRKNLDAPVALPTEPTEPPFVGFEGTPPGVSGNFIGHSLCTSEVGENIQKCPSTLPTEPTKALDALRLVHGRQEATLQAAGIDGIARVLLADWRAALGADEFDFHALVMDLEQAGQIIREHGYARPAQEPPQ